MTSPEWTVYCPLCAREIDAALCEARNCRWCIDRRDDGGWDERG